MGADRWDPFTDLTALRERVNALFENSLARSRDLSTAGHWNPQCDLADVGDTYVLTAELPGVDEKGIQVSVADNQLILRGERRSTAAAQHRFHRMERIHGPFARRFALPDAVDSERVNAVFKNGIRTVTLPKKPLDGVKVAVKAG